jgi:TRAP-type C4-dicarboxylate transport system permease small subunit
MILTTLDVIGRDVFNDPVPGTVELSQYLLVTFVLMGLAYTQQAKGHVPVSVLTSRLPLRGQFLLKITSSLLGLFLFSLLAWQGWEIAMEERTVSDLLRIPQSPFRILVAVAAFLTFLELLIDLGDAIGKLAGKEP